jgi:hypothetical protein
VTIEEKPLTFNLPLLTNKYHSNPAYTEGKFEKKKKFVAKGTES